MSIYLHVDFSKDLMTEDFHASVVAPPLFARDQPVVSRVDIPKVRLEIAEHIVVR